MNSCHNLAVLYFEGDGVKKNNKIALQLFRKACQNGNQRSCEAIKYLNEKGIK